MSKNQIIKKEQDQQKEKVAENYQPIVLFNNQNMNLQTKDGQLQFQRILSEQLSYLEIEEKKDATLLNEQLFHQYISQYVICLGCASELQKFVTNLLNMAEDKEKLLRFEDIIIYQDRKIGINEEVLGNNARIIHIIQRYKENSEKNEEENVHQGIIKRPDQICSNKKKQYRCVLHSLKPAPKNIWQENIVQLVERNMKDLNQINQIDESLYQQNLEAHLKKRSFCVQCRENIQATYKELIRDAQEESDLDDEDYQDQIYEEEDGQQQQHQHNCSIHVNRNLHNQQQHPEQNQQNQQLQQNQQCNVHGNQKQNQNQNQEQILNQHSNSQQNNTIKKSVCQCQCHNSHGAEQQQQGLICVLCGCSKNIKKNHHVQKNVENDSGINENMSESTNYSIDQQSLNNNQTSQYQIQKQLQERENKKKQDKYIRDFCRKQQKMLLKQLQMKIHEQSQKIQCLNQKRLDMQGMIQRQKLYKYLENLQQDYANLETLKLDDSKFFQNQHFQKLSKSNKNINESSYCDDDESKVQKKIIKKLITKFLKYNQETAQYLEEQIKKNIDNSHLNLFTQLKGSAKRVLNINDCVKFIQKGLQIESKKHIQKVQRNQKKNKNQQSNQEEISECLEGCGETGRQKGRKISFQKLRQFKNLKKMEKNDSYSEESYDGSDGEEQEYENAECQQERDFREKERQLLKKQIEIQERHKAIQKQQQLYQKAGRNQMMRQFEDQYVECQNELCEDSECGDDEEYEDDDDDDGEEYDENDEDEETYSESDSDNYEDNDEIQNIHAFEGIEGEEDDDEDDDDDEFEDGDEISEDDDENEELEEEIEENDGEDDGEEDDEYEDGEEDYEDDNCEFDFTDGSNNSVLRFLRYNKEKRKIIVPLQKDIFNEILKRSEVEVKAKHANNKETSQQELLICLGKTLKDQIQNFWKKKKSEEIVKYLFLKICSNCLLDNIQQKYEKKLSNSGGYQTILEEYLQEQENAEESKKEKLRKKKERKKEKKRIQKQQQEVEDQQKQQQEEEERRKKEQERQVRIQKLKQKEVQKQNKIKQQQQQLQENKKKQENLLQNKSNQNGKLQKQNQSQIQEFEQQTTNDNSAEILNNNLDVQMEKDLENDESQNNEDIDVEEMENLKMLLQKQREQQRLDLKNKFMSLISEKK